MKFKYVPLPAQHFFMANWDTCLVLPACFWDLEGPRIFWAGMCKSVSFHKKDLCRGHRTFFSKYFRYYTCLNVGREVARIWISSSIKWNRLYSKNLSSKRKSKIFEVLSWNLVKVGTTNQNNTKVYFILNLMKFKYVPLPAQHLGICNIWNIY